MDGMVMGCMGVLVAAAVFGVAVVLPITTALRLHRALALVEQLRVRLSELDDRLSTVSRLARTGDLAAAAAEVLRVRVAGLEERLASAAGPPPPDEQARAAAAGAPDAAPPPAAIPAALPAPPPPAVQPRGIGVPAATLRPVEVPASAAAPRPAPETGVAPPLLATSSEPGASTAVKVGGTLETEIGGRWLLYIGMAALVFGVGFFVKYTFDNEWINETARVVMGAVFGLCMVVAGHRFVRRGYDLYGQVLAGGGFVAMYVSIWAALNLYGLVSRPTAFVLMVVVTAGAALMADGLRSQALAFVALLGGFLTPALVGGREDAQVVLLTYVAVLVSGTLYLASRRGWPWLNFVSYMLTLLTFAGWASVHYTEAKYLTTEVFVVVFAGLFGTTFWKEWRLADTRENPLPAFLLASVAVLFHGASVLNLFPHSLPLLLYLVLFTLAGVAASVKWDRAWVRLLVFLVTMPVFLAWLETHATPGWRAAAIIVALGLYAMHLAAQGERLSRGSSAWNRADLVLFHASALALFAGLYRVVDVGWPYSTPLLALGLAAWHSVLSWRVRALSGEAAVNTLAAAFAMVGFAIGLQFDDWWALVGWAVEAGAIYWAGLKTSRLWMRWGGVVLLLIVAARVLNMGFFATPAGFEAVLNPRAGTTLILVAVAYAMSFFLRRNLGAEPARASDEYAGLLTGANVLTVALISAEINSYWNLRTVDDATAAFSLLASLSMAWGLYGTALLVVGIQRRYAPLRYLAIGLLLLTVLKVFLIDLSELGGVYRIVGFMGLGVFLLLGAWLYQRYRDVILGARD